MPCDRCEEARKDGMKFCPYCGSQFAEEHARIIKKTEGKEKENFGQIFFGLGIGISVLIGALLIFELFVAITGIGTVLGGLDSHPSAEHSLFIVTPFIVKLLTISGDFLKAYYLIILLVAAMCSIAVFVFSVRPFADIGDDGGESAKSSPLYEIATLFAVMYLIEMVYIIIVGATNDQVLQGDTWENMFSLLNASVWEELITRFLIIGVPIAIIYCVRNRDVHELRKIVGGFDNFSLPVIILIVISSAMFGAAHLTSGTWGAWKFFPTFLFGLISGYLFVKYGLYASIAIHFLNDYLLSEAWFTGVTFEPFTMLVLVLVSVMAIPLVYVYGKRIWKYFSGGLDPV